MPALNFRHLRAFHAIAQAQNLTRAAEQLNVSPSALSVQLAQLESQVGQQLFERRGRRMPLTEAGRIALDYAGTIFRAGDEMLDTLAGLGDARRMVLRIGAIATLSRNVQIGLLRPLVGRPDVELVLRSGTLRELLAQLEAHTLDLVLANAAVPRDTGSDWQNHLVEEQPVSLVGRPLPRRAAFSFPESLRETPVLLPGPASELRAAFDRMMDEAGIRPRVAAEVDDMAMLRLMARESPGVALVPPIVVQDELRQKVLVEHSRLPQLRERFYAITRRRRFPNPLVAELLAAGRQRTARGTKFGQSDVASA